MADGKWPSQRAHRPFAAMPWLSAWGLLPSTFISVAGRLQEVRLVCRHAAEGVAGADFGDRALIAVNAAVMPHLKEERAVAEAVAALNALGAADAELLIYRIFVIGVLDVGAFDGGCGAEAVLRAGVKVIRIGLKVAGAQLAVAADRVGVNTLDGGLLEDAMGGAIAAAHTFLGVNLPDGAFGRAARGYHAYQAAQAGESRGARAVAEELATGDGLGGGGVHDGGMVLRLNPKSENRNPKEIRNPKAEGSKRGEGRRCWDSCRYVS
jgi:hypothetical protein